MKDFNPCAGDGVALACRITAYADDNRNIIEKLLFWIGIASTPCQSGPVTTLCLRRHISNHDKFTRQKFRLSC